MKVTSITKSVNIKVNTGDFGNFDVYSSMTAEVEDNDDPREVSASMVELLINEVLEQKAAMDGLPAPTFRYNRPTRV